MLRILFGLIFISAVLLPIQVSGQGKKKSQNGTVGQGAFFASLGFNRSWYSKSTIQFVGQGYDFSLAGSRAEDAVPAFDWKTYSNPAAIPSAQFSARFGYNVKRNFAISFAFDQMNYVFRNQNDVFLSGEINPTVDPVSGWSGTYLNEPVIVNSSAFQYQNLVRMVRLEVMRLDQLWKSDRKSTFGISSIVGVGVGPVLSRTDFLFGGQSSKNTNSLSGFVVSANAGLRAEFFQRFFLQSKMSAGYVRQGHAKTSSTTSNAHTKHGFAFSSWEMSAGMFFYIQSINDCNSCPKW
jgi:hypothetical protein